MADYTKQPAEVIFVDADFSDLLLPGEALDTVLCEAFEHDADSIIADYEITDVDEVIIQLKSGSVISFAKSYPTTGMNTARLVLTAGEVAATEIIDPNTVDEDGYALEVDEKTATIRVQSGSSGCEYRILFTATTNYGSVRTRQEIVEVTT